MANQVTPVTNQLEVTREGAGVNVINHVKRDQYYFNVHVSSNKEALPPFNEAPDLLSLYFTGRENELAQIGSTLDVDHGDTPNRCVIHGMHGLGKTQLALEYAKSAFERQRYTAIFWISASTIEKLNYGFVDLLDLVNHPDRFSLVRQEARLKAAQRWLENSGPIDWLLVLDNVDGSTLKFLVDYLPRKNRRGNILFTTRTDTVATALLGSARNQHKVIELVLPGIEEAVKLLLEESDMDASSVTPAIAGKAEEVVRCVGCLPLAVSHMASYMKDACKSLDDILQLFHSEHRIQVLSNNISLVAFLTFIYIDDRLGKRSVQLRAEIRCRDVHFSARRFG
jgi:NB-ARC domain